MKIEELAANYDIRQSDAYAQYMQKIGWSVEYLGTEKIKMYTRKILLWRFAKIQRPPINFKISQLQQLINRKKIFLAKIEPRQPLSEAELKKNGYKNDNDPYLCSKTILIDLRLSSGQLLASFSQSARAKIKHLLAENHTIEINNHQKFYEIFKKSQSIKKLWLPPKKQFDDMMAAFGEDCFSIIVDGSCGCFVVKNKILANYLYAATLPEAKRADTPYLLIWQALNYAQKLGCQVWDFDGIYDPRWSNESWKSFTHFKRRFHGTEIDFQGSFKHIFWRHLV